MTKVLGVNAVGGKLWFCLVDDGGALETEPAGLELLAGDQAGYAVEAFRDECRRALAATAPDRVVILDLEAGGRVPKISDMRTRFTAEALMVAATVDAGVPCGRLARATLRSRLGLPRTGGIADHVTQVFAEPAGKYWAKKRDLAALAARADLLGG
ncbi:hypothetical protein [Actinoplanes sp. NPDC051494]|uniref:hypothetical protein n=1 Tax=Actinoplanes sp. NPDC051494 TaxID=3363907 RepID=UPI003793ED26